MADKFTIVRYSESLPIFSGNFEPVSGTETLTGVVASLQDAQGKVVSSVSAVAATGFDNGASSGPYAWLNLHPKASALPVPETFQDCYTLWFLATDSAGSTYESVQGVVVRRDGT